MGRGDYGAYCRTGDSGHKSCAVQTSWDRFSIAQECPDDQGRFTFVDPVRMLLKRDEIHLNDALKGGSREP